MEMYERNISEINRNNSIGSRMQYRNVQVQNPTARIRVCKHKAKSEIPSGCLQSFADPKINRFRYTCY
jgi:hypothetical protein